MINRVNPNISDHLRENLAYFTVTSPPESSIYRAARDGPGKRNAEKKILKGVRNGCRTYFTVDDPRQSYIYCVAIDEPETIFYVQKRQICYE